jgi:hypothetical protein
MNDAMANGFHAESAALSQEFNDSKECGPMVYELAARHFYESGEAMDNKELP